MADASLATQDPGYALSTDQDQASGLLKQILDVILGQAKEADKEATARRRILNSVYHIEIPAMGGSPNTAPFGSGVLGLGLAELHGPRTGIIWNVTRVTVSGTGSTEVLFLYRVSANLASQAVGANLITTFTGTNPAPFTPGKGATMLRAGEFLFLYGTGLTNASTYQLNAEAVSIAAEYEGAYLL